MSTYTEFLKLLPSEFVGKEKLNSILFACAKQYDEISNALIETNTETQLETAKGVNLDYIGTILSCSRTDAFEMMKAVDSSAINDEVYRRCLKFKIMKNNGCANYYDVMKGATLLWGEVNKRYSEDSSSPASFVLELDDVDLDDIDPAKSAPLILKGNGIKAKIRNTFRHAYDSVDQERFMNETLYGSIFWFYDGHFEYDNTKEYRAIDEEVIL